MKASRFSDAQKAFILKQGADGLLPTEMKRLKQRCQSASERDPGSACKRGPLAVGLEAHRP